MADNNIPSEEEVRRVREYAEQQERIAEAELKRANARRNLTGGPDYSRATREVDGFTSSINNSTVSVTGLNGALKLSEVSLLKVGKNLKESLNPKNILEQTMQLEQVSNTLIRESMGQTRVAGDAFMETLINTTDESLRFGITMEDNVRLMSDMNNIMQTNTFLTEDQMLNMGILARNAGVSSTEIASIAKGFADIGVGTETAIERIGTMQKQARDYGINVGTFMKTISSNMKLLSTYNFKEGVDGFSKMLAKAQALRIDVSSTFALSEKLLDPEQAIETAAGFQMLGGAIGDLGDPFKLLNMAQTDVAGLQDAMLGMAESAVIFDEETGEFDIPVAEMYRLREAAKLAGKSYEEFTQDAIKAKQRTEKLEILDSFGRFDEKTQEMIASLSEFDGGELKVKLPGYEEAINVASLSGDQLETMRKMQEENAMSEKDIAHRSMTALEAMNAAVQKSALAGVLMGVNTEAIDDMMEAFEAGGEGVSDVFDETFSKDNLSGFGDAFTEAAKEGFADAELNKKLAETMMGFVTSMDEGAQKLYKTIPDKLEEGNFLKAPGLLSTVTENLDKLGIAASEVDLSKIIRGAEVLGGIGNALGGLGISNEMLESMGIERTLEQRDDETLERLNSAESVDDFILPSSGGAYKYDKNDLLVGVQQENVSSNISNITNQINQGGDFNSANTRTTPTEMKLSFDKPLKIELDGGIIKELTPEQLRKIFNSEEFEQALAMSKIENTKYGNN